MQLCSSMPRGSFVSPLVDVSISTPPVPVLTKRSVKRKLVFDQVTQITERTIKFNSKSWKKTLCYNKVRSSVALLMDNVITWF